LAHTRLKEAQNGIARPAVAVTLLLQLFPWARRFEDEERKLLASRTNDGSRELLQAVILGLENLREANALGPAGAAKWAKLKALAKTS